MNGFSNPLVCGYKLFNIIIEKKVTKLICITSRSIPADSFAQNDLKPQVNQCADGRRSCLVRVQVYNLKWSFSFIKN